MFSKILWIPWYTRSTPRLWGTLPNLCSLYRPVSAKLFMEALARTWAAWMGYMGRIRRPLGLVLAYLLGKKTEVLHLQLFYLHFCCCMHLAPKLTRVWHLSQSHNFPSVKFCDHHELLSNQLVPPKPLVEEGSMLFVFPELSYPWMPCCQSSLVRCFDFGNSTVLTFKNKVLCSYQTVNDNAYLYPLPCIDLGWLRVGWPCRTKAGGLVRKSVDKNGKKRVDAWLQKQMSSFVICCFTDGSSRSSMFLSRWGEMS